MDLISRKAAIEEFEDMVTSVSVYGESAEARYATNARIRFIEKLNSIPSVPAVPVKHGRWQWLSSTYDRIPCEMRYMCDKCRHETITHGHEPWEKYCPNCGAKMDLEEQDAAD